MRECCAIDLIHSKNITDKRIQHSRISHMTCNQVGNHGYNIHYYSISSASHPHIHVLYVMLYAIGVQCGER